MRFPILSAAILMIPAVVSAPVRSEGPLRIEFPAAQDTVRGRVEVIGTASPEPQPSARAISAFPAPTAPAESAPSPDSPALSPAGVAFLTGSVLAFLGFAANGIRSGWLQWKHRRFVREVRKGGPQDSGR